MLALFALLLVLVTLLLPEEPPLSGRATASDGDSLRLGNERVRLLGIDAPELDQTCWRDGENWPCGRDARAYLSKLLAGQVRCQPDGADRYGRVLAYCRFDDVDLGGAIVSAGYAISTDWDYRNEEAEARAARRGIWASTFDEPQVWRRQHGRDPESIDLLEWLRRLF